MYRGVLQSCWPFLLGILVCTCVLWALIRVSGARLRLRHLRQLHGDEVGGVQSLSFVLTLPLFIFILMFIVQLSQITIARIVVEYAAYSAARSAVVWIPARLDTNQSPLETENRIGTSLAFERSYIDPDTGREFSVYRVLPGGRKHEKVHFAAAMACMSVSPSRDVGAPQGANASASADAMRRAYLSLSPDSATNSRIPTRLARKIAYALDNTQVLIEVHHSQHELPLMVEYERPPDTLQFTPNEVGWQDQVVVTVRHDFALLPGPGRLLARSATARPGTDPDSSPSGGEQDEIQRRIRRYGGTYVYPLVATARLGNEGERPVLAYVQRWHGMTGESYTPFRYPGDAQDGTDMTGSTERHDYDRDEETYFLRTDENGTTVDESGNRFDPNDPSDTESGAPNTSDSDYGRE